MRKLATTFFTTSSFVLLPSIHHDDRSLLAVNARRMTMLRGALHSSTCGAPAVQAHALLAQRGSKNGKCTSTSNTKSIRERKAALSNTTPHLHETLRPVHAQKTPDVFSTAQQLVVRNNVSENQWTMAYVHARTAGEPPRPSAMAHTMELLPLPFGPMTRFSRGPCSTAWVSRRNIMQAATLRTGRNSTSSYVRKLCMRMRTMLQTKARPVSPAQRAGEPPCASPAATVHARCSVVHDAAGNE